MMPIHYQRQLSQKSRRTPISTNRLDSLLHQRIIIDLIQKESNQSPGNTALKLQKHSSFTLKPNRLPSIKMLKDYGLTEEEKGTYGDRQLLGFDKLELLGRGGFALVWLASKGNQKVALKQIAKPQQSKEAKFSYIKSENIVQIIGVEHSNKDTWIIQELGGKPLSKVLYIVKPKKKFFFLSGLKIKFNFQLEFFDFSPKFFN